MFTKIYRLKTELEEARFKAEQEALEQIKQAQVSLPRPLTL